MALCAATYYNYYKIQLKGSVVVPRAAHGTVDKLPLELPKAAAAAAVKDVLQAGKAVYHVVRATDVDIQVVLQQQSQHTHTTGPPSA
jgi:hypothetical protein